MEKINVLILGSGGREHALAWKIAQSPLLGKLVIAPGNAGTKEIGHNIDINVLDFEKVKQVVLSEVISLVVVGPEEPLVKGITDFFKADPLLSDVLIIGPDSKGAALEGSKDFAKRFMKRHGIPTAAYETFNAGQIEQGINYLKTMKPPYVLKADGLAAGKGVVICSAFEEAVSELKGMLIEKRFGSASENVVIEEFLDGIELSAFALTDGNHCIILPEAKDYKRIGEGDTGLNTGGMGSISPVPFADKEFMKKVQNLVFLPTIEGLKADGIHYCGFIFAGLMNVNGLPVVIEYNVRLGDPETEVVLPRIQSDFLEILVAAATGNLFETRLEIDPGVAACVMLVSGGYPEKYEKGVNIIVEEPVEGSYIFHAGTTFDPSSKRILTSGGRVIAVVSQGDTIEEAVSESYKSISRIHFNGMCFRRDIGKDLMHSGN
jgi:phosphoribosylamine--glycine ligase